MAASMLAKQRATNEGRTAWCAFCRPNVTHNSESSAISLQTSVSAGYDSPRE